MIATVFASWLMTYVANTEALAEADDRLRSYEQLAQGIPVRNVSDADFLRILPALDSLRQATVGFSKHRFMPVSFGLDQEEKIAGRQRDAYQRALNGLLLPRMIVQLQKQLTEADGKDPDKTFDTLKLYEMLGGLGPLDRTFLVQQADDMFATLYRGDGRIAARQSLGEHVRAMAGGSLPAIELDARLIAKVRETIRSVTPATRTFDILAGSTEARALPSWTPAAAFGALGDRAFDRTSGAPLTQGIEGLFTADGYRRVVMPGVAAAARVALSEGWVRGADDALSGETVEHVSQGALQLYFDRFEKRWADLFADIRIKPSQSLGDAVETTRALANDRNILAEAARSIAAATDLRPQTANSLAPLVASADGDSVAAVLASTVNAADPYARLRDAFAAKPGTGSTPASQKPETDTPGAMLLTKIKALHDQLARSATSSAEVAKVFDVDSQLTKSNEDLLQLSRQLPAPLDAWTAGLAADVGSIAAKAARNRASDVWSADGAALCSSIVAGRYPFVRSAERDVSLADFTRLFWPERSVPDLLQATARALRRQDGHALGLEGDVWCARPAKRRDCAIRECGQDLPDVFPEWERDAVGHDERQTRQPQRRVNRRHAGTCGRTCRLFSRTHSRQIHQVAGEGLDLQHRPSRVPAGWLAASHDERWRLGRLPALRSGSDREPVR